MKSFWTVLSVLAVANALGFGAFFAWLGATDRLDRARLEQVRTIFAPTLEQSRAADQKQQALADAETKAAAERARLSKPAVTTEDELAARYDATEIDRQRRQRIKDEIAQLQRTLSDKVEQLAAVNAQIAQARAEFEDMTRRTREQTGDQQFKKTLAVLEGLKPAEATAMLRQTMDTGASGKEQVISYLNAMEEESRTNILQVFVKEDPKLAAELLDRLRTRGLPPPAPGEPVK